MEIIERKCPNCGAELKFNDNNKSCKCEYCHKSYEIKRDINDNLENLHKSLSNIDEQYILNEITGFGKFFSKIFIIIFAIVFISIIILFVVFSNISNSNKNYTNVDQISSNMYSYIDDEAKMEISNLNIDSHGIEIIGSPKRISSYLAVDDNDNILICVYKVKYQDFFNVSNETIAYIPVEFDDIHDDIFNINGDIVDNTHTIDIGNEGKKVNGFANKEEIYSLFIKPLEKEYKITKDS